MPVQPSHLGIDPGNTHTAYCLLFPDGTIAGFGKIENEEFVEQFRRMFVLHPEIRVACEMIASYGMAVGASVFETCMFIGRLQEISRGREFVLIPRLEVKLEICKSPKANDSNIRAALLDRFGPQGTRKEPGPTYGIAKDVWAALGLVETFRTGNYRPYVRAADRERTQKIP